MNNTIHLNYILRDLSKRKGNGSVWNVRFSLCSTGKVIAYNTLTTGGKMAEYKMFFDENDNYKFISRNIIKTAKSETLFDKFKKICYNINIR